MYPLSRSNDCELDKTDEAEIVSVMKGRRAINQYGGESPDELDWGDPGIGRVHRNPGPRAQQDSDPYSTVRNRKGPQGSNR